MKATHRQELSFWKANCIGWTAFAVSMSLSRIGRFPMMYMLASKFTMGAIGLLLSGVVLRPLYRRTLGDDPPVLRTVLVTGVASYVVAAGWTGLHSLIDLQLVRAMVNPRAFYTSLWQVFGGTLYDAFAMLAWSVLYVAIRHQRALHQERERALEAEALAQRARLDALRWQLNPHFLFNALNAISTLVIDSRSNEAAAMIARLGDLLRSSLELQSGELITVTEEIELVCRYLDIEQVRLGEKLHVVIDVEAAARNALMPPMLLQPLVENAIRHGIAVRTDEGHLLIVARRQGLRLQLAVEDDGPGTSTLPAAAGNGVGLSNTRERLAQAYGPDAAMQFAPGERGGLRVDIQMPFREH